MIVFGLGIAVNPRSSCNIESSLMGPVCYTHIIQGSDAFFDAKFTQKLRITTKNVSGARGVARGRERSRKKCIFFAFSLTYY